MANMLNLPPNIVNTLRFVSVAAFIVSSLFTVFLMTSGTYGVVAVILSATMGILMQSGEILTGYLALEPKLPKVIRATCGLLCLVFLSGSIFASTSWMQNQANEVANEAALGSAEYKQAQEARDLKRSDADSLKAQIATIEQDKAAYQADRKAAHDAYPSNYITVKANHTAETAAQVDKYNQQIAALQAKIEGINTELAVPLTTSSVEIAATDGYTAMFQIIADALNENLRHGQEPWTAQQVSARFFFVMGLAFELLALVSGAVALLNSGGPAALSAIGGRVGGTAGFKAAPAMQQTDGLEAFAPEHKIDPYTGEAKPERPIGFQPPQAGTFIRQANLSVQKAKPKTVDVARRAGFGQIDLADVRRFAEHLAKHAEPNKAGDRMVAPGIRAAAAALKMNTETAKHAHYYLKQHGKLEADEQARKTYLVI